MRGTRRDFFTLLGATAWPSLAVAQGKLPSIGYFGATTRAVESPQVTAFLERLDQHGWSDGRSIAMHFRLAEGFSERSTEIATELVRLKVDVIVTWGTANIAAAKRATRSIPIVFAGAADPVGTGLVASLAR